MADNQPESNSSAGGVLPGTQPSAGNVSSPSGDVDALVKALLPHIAREVERTVQSSKDKRIGKLEGQVGDFAEQLARLKAIQAEGFTEQQALRLMRLETSPDASAPAEPAKVQGSTQPAPNVDTQAVIAAMGFDPGGAEVTEVVRQYADPLAQIAALAARKQAQSQPKQPNPATLQPVGVGGGTPTVSQDALMREYREMTAKIPPGQQGVKARFDAKLAIRKKAAEAGVQSPV